MSFKVKLVAYFLLVSLLPLGAAAWGLHAVARRSETRRVDVRLEAGLRAVVATYNEGFARSVEDAKRLGDRSRFQRALQQGDERTLRRLLASAPDVRLHSPILTAGPAHTIGPASQIDVRSSGKVIGTLSAGVPRSRSSFKRLRVVSSGGTLVEVENGTVVAGSARLRGARLGSPGRVRTQ